MKIDHNKLQITSFSEISYILIDLETPRKFLNFGINLTQIVINDMTPKSKQAQYYN